MDSTRPMHTVLKHSAPSPGNFQADCNDKPWVEYAVVISGDWNYPAATCHNCITESLWFFYDRYYSWKSDLDDDMLAADGSGPVPIGRTAAGLCAQVRNHFADCAKQCRTTAGTCPVCQRTNRVLCPVPEITGFMVTGYSSAGPQREQVTIYPEFIMESRFLDAAPGDAPTRS